MKYYPFVILYSILLFSGHTETITKYGKEACSGSDICVMDQYSLSSFSKQSVVEEPDVRINTSGLFTGLNDEEYNQLLSEGYSNDKRGLGSVWD
ncbi:hypothetical protein E3Q15_00860 [Wallemia mellicola]|nr:hypothetical protein E3Q15_00860 [Wallemia mellicola]